MADECVYRITRYGFKGNKVSIGTRREAAATAGYVKHQNAHYTKVSVKIERASKPEFVDVTEEFGV